ncbi:hypothetical protein HMPREF1631_01490 [Arcanobacterium sp. S3PF19]|nr:hypothetical protein HMPREF1631_01490 [Arcanobacterium sp. S3PF19]
MPAVFACLCGFLCGFSLVFAGLGGAFPPLRDLRLPRAFTVAVCFSPPASPKLGYIQSSARCPGDNPETVDISVKKAK